ncbi:hypothetical protein M422DRAFT_62676 [Sphaerobolus stellatus SS14]|nr:hypothetical protein M422DRAFT_62676 [Sphaerobolus stellatus SS14]
MTVLLSDLTDEQTRAAQEGIAFHQAKIATIDAEIFSLLASIGSLRKVKEKHLGQLRKWEGVLTLARRLPTELLGHIFEYCAAVYPMAPLVVSQVCTSWRVAAQSTPRIWSSLIIDCGRPRAAERAAHWLKMSGVHVPLKVALFLHDTSLQTVLRILIPYNSRLSHLTVDAVLYSHAQELLDTVEAAQCSFPILHSFDLTVHEQTDRSIELQNTFIPRSSPRLQHIRLRSAVWPLARFPQHLTSLTISISSPEVPIATHTNILRILRSLPQLSSFTLDFPDGSFVEEGLDNPGNEYLVMTHLESMILTGCHQLFNILEYLTLPALRRLALREIGKDSINTPRIGSWFTEMLSRSLPPISTLELHCIDGTDMDFIRWFMLLPTLEEFLLHDSEISNAVFRALSSPIAEGEASMLAWICPGLKLIDLRWCAHLSGKVVAEFVQARCSSKETVNIEKVVVINCSAVREADVLHLTTLATCRLRYTPDDFCYYRGCCINARYRHRFFLRHAVDLRERGLLDRLEL